MLKGKTAVVTGAAGTLGLAVVRALLEDGAQVALVDIDALRLDSLIRFLRGTVLAVPGDVTEAGAVRQAQGQVEKVLGPIDVLVNAASASSASRSEATTDDEWRRVLAVNVDGAFYWSRAVMPGMRKRGFGRVVNVGAHALKPDSVTAGPALSASRGALAALTASLAREAAAQGVTVNALAPAFVESPALDEQLNEAQRRQLLTLVPAGRFCRMEEFVHAVRFLASPLAGYITGQVLTLDGGLSTR